MKHYRLHGILLMLALLLQSSCKSLDRTPQEQEDNTPPVEVIEPTEDDSSEELTPIDPVEPAPEELLPPIEVFFIDQENLPDDAGIAGTSYTALVYVLDNTNKRRYGPFNGSTYPNSQENPSGSDRPNRVSEGPHYFNNLSGHKGQTKQGLNLVNTDAVRIVPGYSWSLQNTEVQYANVHTGFSDKGNYNSRGSQGCPTIHPDQVDDFMALFDFSIPNWEDPPQFTLGTSEGIVYIFREDEPTRNQLINEIESIYE